MIQYKIKKFQYLDPNIDVIEMKNEDIEVHVSTLGCTILSIFTKDKNEVKSDIVLGFDDRNIYLKQDKYIGAIVGRVAGRIKDAMFTLNEQEYHLEKNNGENALHGGLLGFDKQIFKYEMIDQGICLHYLSKDLEAGYPGNMEVSISYTLVENKLIAHYEATCDQDSIVNITNHTYFNLAGCGTVLNHELLIDSDEILCSDETGCANGVRLKVKDTPFDFNTSKQIGRDIDKDHEQLKIGGGYDHYYIFNQTSPSVILKDKKSGRVMKVNSDQKGAQIYSANFLDGTLKGKNNWYFNKRDAICIETQSAPNAIHIEENPSTILRKGNKYSATTIFEFYIESEEVL
ncbi:MAG: aldose epimerase family protein [Erysipelotrichaceae bacterium]